MEDANTPSYIVTLTNDERQELKELIQRGGKGYCIKHAQILLKLDRKPENETWTYDCIKDAYGASRNTIAGVAKRFVMEGMDAALGRKIQENRHRKVTGDVEARICTIACSDPPVGASRWTMQGIADELIRKAFAPEEARRLAERFEWHYTPKHGSWLDMAEIEIGIMCRQALGKPLPDLESSKKQVHSWTVKRNAEKIKINWQFKTQDARIKLAKLYPAIV